MQRWEDNIKMNLGEIGWTDWINLAEDRPVAGFCEQGNEPSDSIKCWGILEWLSDCWLLKKGSVLWN
jgi:hypothetical protein